MQRMSGFYVALVVGACSSRSDLGDSKRAASGDGSGGVSSNAGGPADSGARMGPTGASQTGSGGAPNDGVVSSGPAGAFTGSAGFVSGEGGAAGAAGGSGEAPPSCTHISLKPGRFNPCGRTTGIDYSPDGTLVAIATETSRPNLHLFDTRTGALVRDLDGIDQGVYDVMFSPDGKVVAVGGVTSGPVSQGTNLAKVYDVATGAEVSTVPTSSGFYVATVAFSSDGKLFATAGAVGSIEIWRVSDWKRVTAIDYPSTVYEARFLANGSLLAGAEDGRVTVYDVPSGQLVMTLAPTVREMSHPAASPDQTEIATAGPNNEIQFWDASKPKLLQSVPAHSVYVSRILWLDQDHVVSNDWNGVIAWMTRNASGEFVDATHWDAGGQSIGLAISPDKKTLAAAAMQGTVEGFEFFAIDAAQL